MKVTTITKIAASSVASLVLATLPVVTAHAATQNTNSTINAVIGEVISLSVSGNVTISATPGAGVATGSHDVTVGTNNTTGYTLSLASSATDTTLAKAPDLIAASSAPFDTPAVLAADTWGYRLSIFTADTYAGIVSNAATAPTLKTTTAPVAAEVTPVTWGVNVTAAKPSGTYTREVTYTAVTRP